MVSGLIPLASFLLFDEGKLILDGSNIFLIKYFPIVLIGNSGILLISLGVLFYKKLLVPYFSGAITRYEKAKNQIYIFIFSIPTWVSLSAYVFFQSENKSQKLFWCVLLIYFGWIVVKSV